MGPKTKRPRIKTTYKQMNPSLIFSCRHSKVLYRLQVQYVYYYVCEDESTPWTWTMEYNLSVPTVHTTTYVNWTLLSAFGGCRMPILMIHFYVLVISHQAAIIGARTFVYS